MRIIATDPTCWPLTRAHLGAMQIARQIRKADLVVAVTPKDHPWKPEVQSSFKDRLAMLWLGISNLPVEERKHYLVLDDWVNNKFTDYLTCDFIQEIAHLYPGAEIDYVMGSDGLPTFWKWLGKEQMVSLLDKILIIPRGNDNVGRIISDSAFLMDLKLRDKLCELPDVLRNNTSGTLIRMMLEGGFTDVSFAVPNSVQEYIFESGLFGAKKAVTA